MIGDFAGGEPDVVYTAQSKRFFYCRDAVCQYVFDQGKIPVNPFRMFGYFLGDRVDRGHIRAANNSLLLRADEVWVFGHELADGVLAELGLAASVSKSIRFFSVDPDPERIHELHVDQLAFEQEVRQRTGRGRDRLLSDLKALLGEPNQSQGSLAVDEH